MKGERERDGEERKGTRLRETELGGKIEMSNYQMMAVDSGISMGVLGENCPGCQTEHMWFVCFCV